MPMWISWVNPTTGKRERIYNYGDPDTDAGKKAVTIARRSLSEKFSIPEDAIPEFRMDEAPWLTPSERQPDIKAGGRSEGPGE